MKLWKKTEIREEWVRREKNNKEESVQEKELIYMNDRQRKKIDFSKNWIVWKKKIKIEWNEIKK